MFSKSYKIKLKSDYIYHFPIDLEQQQTDSVRLLFQINGMVNTIQFRVDLIRFGKDFSRRRAGKRSEGRAPQNIRGIFYEKKK